MSHFASNASPFSPIFARAGATPCGVPPTPCPARAGRQPRLPAANLWVAAARGSALEHVEHLLVVGLGADLAQLETGGVPDGAQGTDHRVERARADLLALVAHHTPACSAATADHAAASG